MKKYEVINMCLPNINITAKLYKNVYTKDDIQCFEAPFDTIVAQTKDGVMSISDFYLVLNFNLLGTANEEKKATNIVENRETLTVLIRMAKLSKDISKQLYNNLIQFDIDLSENKNLIAKACVPYVQYERILKVNKLILPESSGLGNYVIKVLVKTKESSRWNVQTMIPLRVE